jgi:hypothetical protein
LLPRQSCGCGDAAAAAVCPHVRDGARPSVGPRA